MTAKKWIAIPAIGVMVVFFSQFQAQAGGRSRSGSYQGRYSSGTFQQQVNRSAGQAEHRITWQNQNGQGNRISSRQWNPESGSGSYSSTTTRANGKTSSRQGTVTHTGEGSYAVQGTRTGGNSNTNVYRTRRENTYTRRIRVTGPDGQTRENVQKVTVDAQ